MAKIVFFSPHSLTWVHAFPEALVAESLMKDKHEIVYITCGEALNASCICLSMMGIRPDSPEIKRAEVCRQCSARAQLIRREMKLPGYSLSSVSAPEDDEKISSIMAGVFPSNFSQLMLEGIPVGKIAAYESLLMFKKMNADFSETEWPQYYSMLKSAIKAFYLIKRILEKEKPDYGISYNSLYSVNAVFTHLARKQGVVPYFMHAGGNLSDRLSTLFIGRDTTLLFARELIDQWSMIKNVPCQEGLLSEVTEHFLELLRGKSVFAYSAAKSELGINVRKYFDILPKQKILVATLSSYDEPFAAGFVGEWPKIGKVLFDTQADWIIALVEWIKSKPGYFLLIRVHPREFPNKRESVRSEHADVMRKLFVDLPQNVRVNWPEDGLSLYDLATETNVFLNAWSSAGAEMTLLGLPVVGYSKEILWYPSDLNYLGETREQYFDQIEMAIKDGWDFERVRKAYRWFAMMFGRSNIRIDDSYAGPPVYENIFQRKIAGGMRRLFPLLEERSDCHKRSGELRQAKLLDQIFTQKAEMSFDVINPQLGDAPTIDQETAFLKIQMRRIAKAMWGDTGKVKDNSKGELFSHFSSFMAN